MLSEYVPDMRLVLMAYLLGSIPFGLIVGKLIWHTDLREVGSHNIGATNAWRCLGRTAGLLTFFLDFGKGYAACLICLQYSSFVYDAIAVAAAVLIGHSLSIFLKFKGGKAVASSLGCLACLMPQVAVCLLIVWGICFGLTRTVSIASCIAAICAPILAAAFLYPKPLIYFCAAATIFVLVRHKDNIRRILAGEELHF